MTEEAASLQERRAPPSAVVIFGASGDLTERKLVQTTALGDDGEAASLQERRAPPSAVVIFGASGDLTERKLVPALANLVRHRRVEGSLT